MNKKEGTYFQVNARAGRFSSTRWYSWAAKESPYSNGADAPFENSRLWNEERRKKTPERKKTTKKCVLVEVGSGWDGFSVKLWKQESVMKHAMQWMPQTTGKQLVIGKDWMSPAGPRRVRRAGCSQQVLEAARSGPQTALSLSCLNWAKQIYQWSIKSVKMKREWQVTCIMVGPGWTNHCCSKKLLITAGRKQTLDWLLWDACCPGRSLTNASWIDNPSYSTVKKAFHTVTQEQINEKGAGRFPPQRHLLWASLWWIGFCGFLNKFKTLAFRQTLLHTKRIPITYRKADRWSAGWCWCWCCCCCFDAPSGCESSNRHCGRRNHVVGREGDEATKTTARQMPETYWGCWGCADSFGSRADRRKYIENSDCELRGENHPNPRVNSKENFWRKPGLNPSCRLPETGKTLAGKIRVCGNYTDSAVALRYEVRLRSAYARSA